MPLDFKSPLFAYSIPWNLGLLTLGSFLLALGIKAVAVPHGLVTGGVSGISLLCYYFTQLLSPGIWLLLLNIPIALLGLFLVSKRFVFYTAYGMLAISGFMESIHYTITVDDTLLAAITAGLLLGSGVGFCLRSLGSSGGLDILSVILHQKYGFRLGQISFLFNLCVFSISFILMDTDIVLYSLILVFVSAQMTDSILAMFNHRKLMFIISNKPKDVAHAIMQSAHRGVTILEGRGGFTGTKKDVIMTVVSNIQQKKLEEIIFTIDPYAFVIFENTFNVIGKGFSSRKVY